VRQLVIAMINFEEIKDTENSSAAKMFRPKAYDSLLLEATCREIFLALIDRCKSGFRGPAQFNKALKPNRGIEADATASCAERMQNVVNALMWNKRVCKDVLFEDWKIRLLVNHPLSYDKEKDSQKGSNDQRRKRLEAEREKLKKTEELLAYRSRERLEI
jgi:superfamily II helicase